MILNNLFRDQLDRYGEIDITMNLLKDAMRIAPEMTIIVNGDDALSTYLAQESGNPYALTEFRSKYLKNKASTKSKKDVSAKMWSKIVYNFYHYSQLGDYHCPSCDFHRPELNYNASNVKTGKVLDFDANGEHIHVNYRGFYNVYNILAVYAAVKEAGIPLQNFNEILGKYNPENGRMEHFSIKGTEIILNLAKNPAGFNQNISAVMEDDSPKDLIILINDNDQDGIDVSWLWDVDFDRLGDPSIRSITVSGIRCQDMRLRLKYVDIPSILEPDIETAVRKRIADGTGNLYVLVNYTALYSTHNILKRMEGEQS